MFTDIPWTEDCQHHVLNGNSFVFHINKDNSLTKYHHNKFGSEIWHTKQSIFHMDGPIAVNRDRKTANAQLGIQWHSPDNIDRKTVLAGEHTPELDEVEIYLI